jgi:predicted nucleotidyltransferase component of viral defense system
MSTGFDRNTHGRYLTALLTGIIKAIPEKTAFKGGTCAALFYDLPRFSFDLDFDIIRPFEKRDTDAVKEILSANGRIVDEADKKYTLLYEFDYGKGTTKIKIEFNKRVWKNNRYKNDWFMGVPILLADEMTVATNKLVALSDRKSAVVRDLFDAWYFLSHEFMLNEQLLIERTGKGMSEYCAFLAGFIKKTFSRRNVLQGLGDALDDKQKAWAREYLIDETILLLEKISGANLQPIKIH